jgi:hypothetical protein
MKSLRVWLGCVAGLVGFANAIQADSTFLVRGVPSTELLADDLSASSEDLAVPDAEVRFYREGAIEPSIIGHDDAPVTLAEGKWLWEIEAPGWVSVNAGALKVTDGPTEASREPRLVLWPVVPACEVGPDSGNAWASIDRVDFVSLTYQTVHPLRLQSRAARGVPAGRWLAYGSKNGTIVSVGRPQSCRASEQVLLDPIATPTATQDVVVHVELPETVRVEPPESEPSDALDASQIVDASEIEAWYASDGEVAVPFAGVTIGNRRTFFFGGLSEGDGEFLLRHPRLRTKTLRVRGYGGTVEEIDLGRFDWRPDLEVDVDYLPQVDHESSDLVLMKCGRSSGRWSCPHEVAKTPLTVGVNTYFFEGLDDGEYRLDATIDDETVLGLGSGARVDVVDGLVQTRGLPYRVKEEVVWGEILQDGNPMSGYVLFEPVSPEVQSRKFPTDTKLTYEITYFAQVHKKLIGRMQDKEERDRERRESANRGFANYGWRIVACVDSGYCRHLDPFSVIRGSGRLDIEVVGDSLDVMVVNARTGAGIEGAKVSLVVHPTQRLLFENGNVDWSAPHPAEDEDIWSLSFETDTDGRLNMIRPPGDVLVVAASSPGFKREALERPSLAAGVAVELQLEPDDATDSIELELADGRPAAGAFILISRYRGDVILDCGLGSNTEGVVLLSRPECLLDNVASIFHPHAATLVVPADLLLARRKLTLPAWPTPPVEVQILGTDGVPRGGVPVAVD